jgi:hypothetical protein
LLFGYNKLCSFLQLFVPFLTVSGIQLGYRLHGLFFTFLTLVRTAFLIQFFTVLTQCFASIDFLLVRISVDEFLYSFLIFSLSLFFFVLFFFKLSIIFFFSLNFLFFSFFLFFPFSDFFFLLFDHVNVRY